METKSHCRPTGPHFLRRAEEIRKLCGEIVARTNGNEFQKEYCDLLEEYYRIGGDGRHCIVTVGQVMFGYQPRVYNAPDYDSPDEEPPAVVVRRQPSAYIIFCSRTRQQIQVNNPGLTFGELGKFLGALWNSFDEKTKAVSVLLILRV